MSAHRYVFRFGGGHADGPVERRDLLGGKGAGLAEMTNLGLPVPPGFTISTHACGYFFGNDGAWPDGLQAEVEAALVQLERHTDKRLGDADCPLLVSVRSGVITRVCAVSTCTR